MTHNNNNKAKHESVDILYIDQIFYAIRFQESDSASTSLSKSPSKGFTNLPKFKTSLKISSLHKEKTITSDEDDEVETSLSDELNHSWPSSKAMLIRSKG